MYTVQPATKHEGYPYSRTPKFKKHTHETTMKCYLFLTPLLNPNRFRTSPTNLRARKNGIKCNKSLSVGSDIQPSIGIAFSALSTSPNARGTNLHAMRNLLGNYPGYKLSLDLVPRLRGL